MRKNLTATKRSLFLPSSWSYLPSGPNSQQQRFNNAEATLGVPTEQSIQDEDITMPLNLPLSPLIDPKLVSARKRFREPKLRPRGQPSGYEKRLMENPYARALTTSVRQCGYTDARLPSFFLLSFGVAIHPATGDPWHFPSISLDPKPNPKLLSRRTPVLERPGSIPSTLGTSSAPRFSPLITSGSYYLSSNTVLQLLTSKKGINYRRTLPARWKANRALNTDHLVFRQDMDEFTLEELRKQAMTLLKHAVPRLLSRAEHETISGIPVTCSAAAMLWMGNPDPIQPPDSNPESDNHQIQEKNNKTSIHTTPTDPPLYAMVLHRARYIPVYNLPYLLGPLHLESLRDLYPKLFEKETALMWSRIDMVQAQLALWKLMGYLAPVDGGVEETKSPEKKQGISGRMFWGWGINGRRWQGDEEKDGGVEERV